MDAMLPAAGRRPIPAAIAVVIEGDSVLLVRRAHPPDAGYWGFPGGKIEFGERIEEAALRELHEETGIRAQAQAIFAAVDAFDVFDAGAGSEGGELREHYTLIAVLCRRLDGEARAGDDALEAAWFDVRTVGRTDLVMSAGVMDVLRQALDLVQQRPRLFR